MHTTVAVSTEQPGIGCIEDVIGEINSYLPPEETCRNRLVNSRWCTAIVGSSFFAKPLYRLVRGHYRWKMGSFIYDGRTPLFKHFESGAMFWLFLISHAIAILFQCGFAFLMVYMFMGNAALSFGFAALYQLVIQPCLWLTWFFLTSLCGCECTLPGKRLVWHAPHIAAETAMGLATTATAVYADFAENLTAIIVFLSVVVILCSAWLIMLIAWAFPDRPSGVSADAVRWRNCYNSFASNKSLSHDLVAEYACRRFGIAEELVPVLKGTWFYDVV